MTDTVDHLSKNQEEPAQPEITVELVSSPLWGRSTKLVVIVFGLVLLVGLALPCVLLLAPSSRFGDLVTALSVLAGYYTFRFLVFRVGL